MKTFKIEFIPIKAQILLDKGDFTMLYDYAVYETTTGTLMGVVEGGATTSEELKELLQIA